MGYKDSFRRAVSQAGKTVWGVRQICGTRGTREGEQTQFRGSLAPEGEVRRCATSSGLDSARENAHTNTGKRMAATVGVQSGTAHTLSVEEKEPGIEDLYRDEVKAERRLSHTLVSFISGTSASDCKRI